MATTNISPSLMSQELLVDQSRLQRYLGYRLSRASLKVRRLFAQRVGALELKPVEFSILVLADANVGINLRQLGDSLEIPPPNLVQVVNRLIKRKLLKRVHSQSDRRIQHLLLTPQGATLLAEAEQAVSAMEQEIEQLFTATEQRALATGLRKLLRW